MSRHQIDYESLAQDAMRGLVRTVLQRVARSGLPGDHHFYISFHTRAPGVVVSKRLLERYPDEMTIVLQNKFSDLRAQDDLFEVTLWFDSIPERLTIPFAAIKVFFDPSVPFGHQFEVSEAQARVLVQGPTTGDREATRQRGDERQGPVTSVSTSPAPRSRQGSRPETAKPPAVRPQASVPAKAPSNPVQPVASAKATAGKSPAANTPSSARDGELRPKPVGDKPAARPAQGTPDEAAPAEAKVVPLDAFRKKS